MYVCVYIKLSHFVVYEKLIQHSNSALKFCLITISGNHFTINTTHNHKKKTKSLNNKVVKLS